MKLSKDQFEFAVEVQKTSEWLLNYSAPLYELIKLCKNKTERVLISDLLNRFTYLSEDDFHFYLYEFVSTIADTWRLPLGSTQVAAITYDKEADSAQMVLDLLQYHFAENHCHGIRTVNKLQDCKLYVSERPNIVLVDEFVGTGNTILKVVGTLHAMLRKFFKKKQMQPIPYNIRVLVVASMLIGEERIRAKGIDFYSCISLKRGISDYLTGDIRKKTIKRMYKMEELLVNKINRYELNDYRLGYRHSQSLYAAEGRNAPNNVFPIFWWPKLSDGSDRKTICYRLL